MIVSICGFMGAGKSEFLKKIIQNSPDDDLQFIDLDDYIYSKKGKNFTHLSDYIKQIGIEQFREVEFELLGEIYKREQNALVALGGGAVNSKTSQLLTQSQKNILVWLNTPLSVCLERILDGSDTRPLTTLGKDELTKLYNSRTPFYAQAQLILDENEQSKIVSFSQILSCIKKSEIIPR